MALLVPDQAEVLILKAALNHTAGQNVYLKLFCNDKTPAEADTEADYTEASGGGYSAKTLTGSSWTVATDTGTTTAEYAEQTFTFTGALDTNPTIYGYYIVQVTSGKLLWAERAGSTFTPANNGDTYKVTPKITAA